MFDGAVRENKVSLSGASRGRRGAGNESRADLVKRQQRERDEREMKRRRESASLEIQRLYRGYRARSAASAELRALFDKRCSDLAKLEKLLTPEQRAAFVHKAVMTILPLFAFFFSSRQDGERLESLMKMVFYSAQQVAERNILTLMAAEEPRRMSFLVLFERVLAALIRLGKMDTIANLVQQMQIALLQADDATSRRSEVGIGHLLRRTEVLRKLTEDAMLIRPGLAETLERARLCTLVFCAVAEVSKSTIMLSTLLSTPRLLERLASESTLPMLLRLSAALPLPPSAEESAQVAQALQEEAGGAPRILWLIGNLAVLVEQLLRAKADTSRLPVWLGWICWAKGHVPSSARGSIYTSQMLLLNSSSFARSLLRAVDEEDSKQLMPAVLEIYFATPKASEGSPEENGEPATEALYGLAFTTTLTERLYPSVAELARCSTVAAAFLRLGASSPETFDTVAAVQLRAFCSVYKIQLQAMYDAEFHGPANPLKSDQVALVALFLNRLGYSLVTNWPNAKAMPPQGQALRHSITSLVRAFYQRQIRTPLLQVAGGSASKWWQIDEARSLLERAPVVDLGTDAPPPGSPTGEANEEDDDDMQVDAQGPGGEAPTPRSPQQRQQRRIPAVLGGSSAAREVLEAVLEELPHVLPFEDRVTLLHNVILLDQENREETRAPWARSRLKQHRIRRNFLVEDGFAAFDGLNTADGLREVFKVQFVAPDGEPESGIDGGGLFKEFMIHICRETFAPKYGLFASTDDGTLYPLPSAFRVHPNAAELYRFLGKVVGKAVYEMLLLEPQFSRVFLNRILGMINEVDDVAALDREVHKGMLRLKETDNIEELGLTFTISSTHLGHTEDIELVKDGASIPVTKQNLTQYLHYVAHFRTNVQIKRHTAFFVQGLQCVIPLAWLKMFDPYELNNLISGSASTFDVADLRENTGYGNGYHENSPTIKWLWELLEKHLGPEDMANFLMFTTSCSRPPLLGFKTLYPRFGIHRVPDFARLPTASTCANLLKLPEYRSFEELKQKVTEAIRAECGFDLS
mmetsp:Transcript_29420/g.67753  ORF Transcript_29420/g.67753 Transcript_29420/m.67753 type:complete len:1036 (+) Transcript_29420:80-3187(+)